ncbi:hypothetical protein PAPYR_4684 [Paratrimastix pyriformis]|uniref:Uncharacterized protein n=1 Tax=Paratrimastix pyriformis TaxID=342808 RepID=A0ABQ8UPE0_9EUKA|nr:hypothetical protein PAPYR_4684 [Paratrimastix pyriformis]
MSRYLHAKKPDPTDVLASDLSDDLRNQIRSISVFPPLSPQWVALADRLQRICAIALMEQHLPGAERNAGVTIWEVDKLAVRFMIEEARLAVSMRSLSEYWQCVENIQANPAQLEAAAGPLHMTPAELKAKMEQFESSLGLLLECVIQHVEALQTLDMASFLGHVKNCLHFVLQHPEHLAGYTVVDKAQPVVVLLYVYDLFSHIEELRNDREIMGMLVDHDILPLMGAFVQQHQARLKDPFKQVALQAMAMIADHELFDPAEHFKTVDQKRPFALLKDLCDQFVGAHPDLRASLAPLSALCAQLRTQV